MVNRRVLPIFCNESVPEEDVSVGASPLKAIDVDETMFKNGLSLRRSAIRGLNVARCYQPHNAPCRLDVVPQVDSEMRSPSAVSEPRVVCSNMAPM